MFDEQVLISSIFERNIMKTISKIIVATFVLISCSMCSAGSDSNTPTPTPTPTPIAIKISESNNISIAQGEQYQLHAYDDANNDITESVTWVSDNPSIAIIDNNGMVTIESNQGTTDIYAQYNNATSNKVPFTSGRVIFATKDLYNGNLVQSAQDKQGKPTNGIDAANYLCNIDSNKPKFGNFKALIVSSSESQNLSNVLDINKTVNYINKDNSLIGYSQLGTSSILFNGKFVDNNISESINYLNWDGWDLTNTCNDWTNSNSSFGSVGEGNNSNNWFTDTNTNLKGIWTHVNKVQCNNYQTLVCVQQPQQ
jgi:hypothetical protein